MSIFTSRISKISKSLILLNIFLLLTACSKKEEDKDSKKPSGPQATLVSVVQPKIQSVEITEQSLGDIENANAPVISAETTGIVRQILVDIGDQVKAGQVIAKIDAQDLAIQAQVQSAEVNRLQALADQQKTLLNRYESLVAQNFISQTQLETTQAQYKAYKEQVSSAKAQLALVQRNLNKTQVVAPIAGKIDARLVSKGDFVTAGKPIVQLAQTEALRIRLPFPEVVASNIQAGRKIKLVSSTDPNNPIETQIKEVKPMINASNRAVYSIVELNNNQKQWLGGGSIRGTVVLEEHQNAITVPEESIVVRPAGTVVYIADPSKKAIERKVETGAKNNGWIEIKSGLTGKESVIVDGAGFLSDKALIAISKPKTK